MKAKEQSVATVELMAHRGYAERYPENTLEAIQAAADAGVTHIEFDVQLTADGVPVLMHDASLKRTAGVNLDIREIEAADLHKFPVNYRKRFGDTHSGVRIPTLRDAVEIIEADWTYYVEIKRESLELFGVSKVVDAVCAALGEYAGQCVLISFEHDCLAYAGRTFGIRTGWVLRRFDEASRKLASELNPGFLIINALRLGTGKPWPGDWQWACYEITEPEHARQLIDAGIDIISSMAAPDLRQALSGAPEA